MECGFLPRALWTSDSKPHGPAAPEFLTSVQLTRDLPAGVCFGPCILHNTFYDTIAFIALKSCDERSKSYVFRVDPEAMRSSPLLVPWLRLVQAARDAREQNAEAYLRGGQLYFRTVKHVRQGDELLVWYDDELSHLLGFNDITSRASADGFQCRSCDQSFQHVNPFLAHCRFLCSQVKSHVVRPHSDLKQAEVKRSHKVTDFHNIARDLEHRKPSSNEDSAFPRKQKPEEPHSLRNRKTVLLEKTNIPNHDNIRNHSNIPATDQTRLSATEGTLFKRDLSESKSSAFTEVGGASARLTRGQDPADGGQAAGRAGFDGQARRGPLGEAGSDSGLFSLALTQRAPEEQRSAFCKPGKHSAIDPTPHPAPNLTSPPTRSEDVAEGYSAKATLGYRDALASSLLHSELASTATLGVTPAPLLTSASYPYGPEHWARGLGGAVQASPSLPLLPPSFSSLGVSVQNWCAKCNLSFRMTSDLVFHMRSHHKKEFAGDAQVRKRREDELTCPICHEYFRERHHLSRHMTSHN